MNKEIEINPWKIKCIKVLKREKNFTVYDYCCNKGKSTFTVYDLFPGVQITFQDFNTEELIEGNCGNENIIEINHCLRGRVEWEFPNNTYSYIGENEISISSTKYLPTKFCFPLNVYYGMAIVIDKKKITKNFCILLNTLGIDLQDIYNKLSLDKNWYTNKDNGKINHIFNEIYTARDDGQIDYFKIKILDVLYFISKLTKGSKEELKYYSGKQVKKVKEIRQALITNLDKSLKLDNITKDYNMSLSMFRTIFKQIYGDTPYAYIKKYKMNKAAFLIATTDLNISNIALSLGYLNASKFTEAFKDINGVLPKDYKKENNFLEHFRY
ncbi:AraC family transcriptional regulator [Clostridiaceae bacterium 14S0207]|nr:AraC family transcriptional regulator [Clostridiaceae bacterium 14S0207]